MKDYIITTLVMIAFLWPVQAQDYSVSFRGIGASRVVDSVKVENINQGTNLSLAGNEVLTLHPDIPTKTSPPAGNYFRSLLAYPNPCYSITYLEFTAFNSGESVFAVYDQTGKPVFSKSFYLEQAHQKFSLSGLQKGIYLLTIIGRTYNYSAKLISINPDFGNIRLEPHSFACSGPEDAPEKYLKIKMSALASASMSFNEGDRLKFTGRSGGYATIVVCAPVSDTTIIFQFVPCTDGDNNNYPVVKIGTQTWMAENLRTTRFSDSAGKIANLTDEDPWRNAVSPAYSYYNNQTDYFTRYGALYNWHAVGTGRLCPSGWHVPDTSEISALTGYLRGNGYGFKGRGIEIAKSLADYSGWAASIVDGAIGNEQVNNNQSGFTAVPGGSRSVDGHFTGISQQGNYWLGTGKDKIDSYYWSFNYNSPTENFQVAGKQNGCYIKCIKNPDNTLGKGKVVFTCDDGDISQYNLAYPMFVSRGKKFTLYATAGARNYSSRISWPRLLEMQKAGFDIQGHGYTHLQYSTLTEAQLRQELTASSAEFVANGLSPPVHEAYPYSNSSETVRIIVGEYRKTARNTNGGTVIRKNVDKLNLPLAADIANLTTDNFSLVKQWVDYAASAKVGVIFMFHSVRSDYNDRLAIHIGQLTALLDYCLTKDVDVITISELYEELIR